MSKQPIRTLYCACCGSQFKGRQFFNQDTGHGLCYACSFSIPARSVREPYTVESFERCYGVRGVHHAVSEMEVRS